MTILEQKTQEYIDKRATLWNKSQAKKHSFSKKMGLVDDMHSYSLYDTGEKFFKITGKIKKK